MSSTINPSAMLMQMNALKVNAGGNLAGISGLNNPKAVDNTKASDFGALFKEALDTVNDMQVTSNDLKTRYELGDKSLSLSDVMISSQKAGIALEATIQVRNELVDAYKTVMQMQI